MGTGLEVYTSTGKRIAGPTLEAIAQRIAAAEQLEQPLRALRMWHWRQLLVQRAIERVAVAEGDNLMRSVAAQQANAHMKFVQLLNDLVDGTAEQDCRVDAEVKRKALSAEEDNKYVRNA